MITAGWLVVGLATAFLLWRVWQRYDRMQRQQRRQQGRPVTPRGPLPPGIRTRSLHQHQSMVRRVGSSVRSRGPLGGLIFFLIVVASLLVSIQLARSFSAATPYPNLVVAIAPFTSANAASSADGSAVAHALQTEWSSGTRHRLQQPLQLIALRRPVADATAAVDIARSSRADVVIWGTVEAGGSADAPSLLPQLLWLPRQPLPFEQALLTQERLALPPVYAPASSPINGEAVLGELLDILDLVQTGDLDQAQPRLDTFIARYSDMPGVRLDLVYGLRGSIALMKDEALSAEADFRQALRSAGQRPEYWNDLGVALALQGRSAEALQAYNTALTLASGQLAQPFFNRGLLSLESDDPAIAVADLAAAHSLNPRGPRTLRLLAEAQRRANDLNAATDSINDLLTMTGDEPLARIEAARLQLALLAGNGAQPTWELELSQPFAPETVVQLREWLDAAVASLETQVVTWRQQAASADAAGQHQQALVAESNARIASRALLDAQYWRSIALMQEGIIRQQDPPGVLKRIWNGLFGADPPFEQAQTLLKGLISANPGTYDFHVQLGRVLRLQGFYGLALEQYTKASEINSLRPEAWYGIAIVLVNQPNPPADRDDQVRDALRQAIAADPRFTPAYVLQASFEIRQRQWAGAMPALQWLIASRPNEPVYQLQLGQTYREAGLLVDAERTLLPLANANNSVALVELGRVYAQASKPTVSEEMFQRAYDLDPTNAVAAYELGRSAQERGDYARAETAYQRAITIDANYVDAYLALGQLYSRTLNQPQKAISAYQSAIRVGDQDAQSYEDLGRAFMELGAYDQAADALQRAVGLNENVPESRHLLAQAYLGLGRYDAAREQERAAIARTSSGMYPEAQIGIGESFRLQGRFDEAIAAFNSVLDTEPNNPDAYVGMGRTAADQRDWQGAIGYYNQALARNASNAPAHFWLAEALSAQGFFSRAEQEYETAISGDPEYTEAYFGLGRSYARMALQEPDADPAQIAQDEANARQYLDIAIQRRPGYGEALLERAQLNERQGHSAAALDDYTRASDALTRNAEAPFLRGKLLLSQNDLQGATTALELAVRRDPTFAPAQYWLGRAYRAQSQPAAALKSFSRALELNPGFVEARYYLGLTQQEGNQLDAARESYSVILAQALPDDSWRQQAEERLRELNAGQ